MVKRTSVNLEIERHLSTQLEFFQEHGCLLSRRIVWLGSVMMNEFGGEGGVDFLSSSIFIKNLIYLNSLSDDPITIIGNTPGGSVFHGLAIFDVINSLTCDVNFIGIGQVMSMGTIIMQACKTRQLTINTTFMIHDGSDGFSGDPKSMKAWADYSEKERMKSYNIYLNRIREKHPDFKLKKVEQMCAFDTILTAEEAMSFGLADSIIKKLP